jgi:hypothetical protein
MGVPIAYVLWLSSNFAKCVNDNRHDIDNIKDCVEKQANTDLILILDTF